MLKRLIISFIFLLALNQSLSAKPIIVPDKGDYNISIKESMESFVDPSGLLTIDELGGMQEGQFLFPIGEGAVWLRVHLQNPRPHEAFTYLWFNEPYVLEHVEAYIKADKPNQYKQILDIGGLRPLKNRIVKSKDLVLPVEIEANSDEVIYFKIEHKNGAPSAHLHMIDRTTFEQKDRINSLLYSLFFGAILVMFIFNLLLGVSLKERALIYYTMYLFFMSVILLNFSGLGIRYLWGPLVQEYGITVSSFFTGAGLILFSRNFLNIKIFSPKMIWIINVFLVLFAFLAFAGIFFIHPSVLVQMMFIADMINIVFFFWILAIALRNRYAPAYAFTIAWLAFFVGSFLMLLSALRIITPTMISQYGLHIGMLWQMVFISLATGDRLKLSKLEIAELSQKKSVELEKIVAQRTETIRLILDHVQTGFFLINREGHIQGEYSLSCYDLFDQSFAAGKKLIDISAFSESDAKKIESRYQSIFKSKKPVPKSLLEPIAVHIKNRILQITLKAISGRNRAQINYIIFSATDITDLSRVQAKRKNDAMILDIAHNSSYFNAALNEFKRAVVKSLERVDGTRSFRQELWSPVVAKLSRFKLTGIIQEIEILTRKEAVTASQIKDIEQRMENFIKEYLEVFGIFYKSSDEKLCPIEKEVFDRFQNSLKNTDSEKAIKAKAIAFGNSLYQK